MRQHVGVSKSQYSQTKTTQVLTPYSVILSHLIRKVLATINFNNQLCLGAKEVDYIIADGFLPVARFSQSLIKLVPTQWGAPTFEIDGIKMLPTAQVSPYGDAEAKVKLIQPRGKVILDCCGGLGYFAAWCVQGQARQVLSLHTSR